MTRPASCPARFARSFVLTAALVAMPSATPAQAPDEGQTNLLILAADAPAMGSPEAPIVVVEAVDFRCPFCADQAAAALAEIVRRYVEPGVVRYVALDLPVPAHPEAERDAVAARCAGEQGAYWFAHELLLVGRRGLGPGPLDLDGFASALGLDGAALASCVGDGRPLAAVRGDAARAASVRVDATPTLLLGFPGAEPNSVEIARYLRGAVGLEPVVEAIEALRESLRQRALREVVDR